MGDEPLRQHRYGQQGRAAKGLLRRYLMKLTGMSRIQITRLIARQPGNQKARTKGNDTEGFLPLRNPPIFGSVLIWIDQIRTLPQIAASRHPDLY